MNAARVLDGKVAIVTGGARGIGRAIAEGFAAAGAIVCVADILADDAVATAAEIDGAFAVTLDVTKRASIAAMADAVIERAGAIDILVNNAGVFSGRPFLDCADDEFDRVFAINVRGYMATMQEVARRMIAQGRKGSIVNLASDAGRRGHPASSVYNASKAAVINLSQSAALALIGSGIRVNAIAPGAIGTAMWGQVEQSFVNQAGLSAAAPIDFAANIPQGRLGRPHDIVGPAVFLASDASDYVVAQTLSVDGGLYPS
jgi:D-sorbitol dehydrogenase (acceptor)